MLELYFPAATAEVVLKVAVARVPVVGLAIESVGAALYIAVLALIVTPVTAPAALTVAVTVGAVPLTRLPLIVTAGGVAAT